MEPYDVGGNPNETHNSFLLVADERNGKSAIFWGTTHVRVVCSNTFALAKQSSSLLKISHMGDPSDQLKLRRDLVTHAIKERKETVKSLNYLFTKKVAQDQVNQVLESAYPLPKEPKSVKMFNEIAELDTDAYNRLRSKSLVAEETWKSRVQATLGHRSAAMNFFNKFNDEQPYAANTGYALFNAITEEINHGDLYRGDDVSKAKRVVFGDKSKQMWDAYNTVLTV
jgi:hypothetical protein